MSGRPTWESCREELSADDENALVALVQAHVTDEHRAAHEVPREHILARLRNQTTKAD